MDSVVTCPNCNAKNRLRQPPAGQVPVCGRCGNPLPWLTTASDADFGSALAAPVPVLVDFWAPWCAPCRMVAPVLEQLAAEQRGKLKVVKLNVDDNPATAEQFSVRSIPTLILFEGGAPRETIIGALPKQALLQKLGPYLQAG